jgi:hypothetical protein
MHWIHSATATHAAPRAFGCLAFALAFAAATHAQPHLEGPRVLPEGLQLRWQHDSGQPSAYTVQVRGPAPNDLWLVPPASFPWPTTALEWLDTRPPADSVWYRVLAVPSADRGQLLGTTSIRNYTVIELGFLFSLAGIPLTPEHPVAVHKLVYETVGPWGERRQASGVIAIPQKTGEAWPLVTYQHGTLAKRSEAPSANSLGEALLGVAFASAGYVAVLPDYLGLGDSTGVHPYHHARSHATTGVDALRAARRFCTANSVELNDRLFLCGYSQGGYAAMAVLRELERFHPAEFPVTAAATMAGAYDLSGVTADDFLSDRPMPSPYYFALLLAAYQDLYQLAPTLADLLTPPYDTTLPPLLQGQHTGAEIDAKMPAVPTQVLKAHYLAGFRADPQHPLRQALRDNDLIHWRPQSALRLYHCDGDQAVSPANAEAALASFHAAGATQVQLFNPQPGAGHGDCSEPSLLAAKAWFDSLR